MWYKVKRIMMWQNWEEKQVRPYRFNPTSSTILYCPLKDDTADYSSNHYTITQSWTITKSDIGYQFGSNGRSYLSTPSVTLDGKLSPLTISFYQNYTVSEQTGVSYIIISKYYGSNSSPYIIFNIGYYNPNNTKCAYMIWNTSNQLKQLDASAWTNWWWHNIICTLSWWTMKIYVDWLLDNTLTWVWTPKVVNTPIYIWAYQGSNNEYFVWKLSDIIIENKEWTATEISNYYNQTKSNYWL